MLSVPLRFFPKLVLILKFTEIGRARATYCSGGETEKRFSMHGLFFQVTSILYAEMRVECQSSPNLQIQKSGLFAIKRGCVLKQDDGSVKMT